MLSSSAVHGFKKLVDDLRVNPQSCNLFVVAFVSLGDAFHISTRGDFIPNSARDFGFAINDGSRYF